MSNPLKEYIPGLDSIQTTFKFFENKFSNIPGIPADKLQQLQGVAKQIKDLQSSLQRANDVQQFIKEREFQLKNQLQNSGLGKELTSLNKEAFYYQQQLAEYKSMLNDKKKLERKLLAKVKELPAFKEFMKKNSYLGQLFNLPDDYGSAASILGLQTKNDIMSLLGQRFGTTQAGGNNGITGGPQQYIQQQIQGAQQQIQQLQNKVQYLGIGGGSSKDIVMPDFKPNAQKTKSFLKRLEYGTSFTTNKSTSLVPAITDIGLTAGYKISDKSIAGIGTSYKLGLGTGMNHIQLSSQGIGFRGYVDIKAKGSIWISGGFEYNYLNAFKVLETLHNLDVWQKSALIGLSKKYKISAKKSGNLQFLYDMLYKQHRPQSQPVIFRLGYRL